MKPKSSQGSVVALALTWDGARWPARNLSRQAATFLKKEGATFSRAALTRLLSDDKVRQLRICWVPRLKGGTDVLAEPFETLSGQRMAFRPGQTTLLGDCLGVVYRR